MFYSIIVPVYNRPDEIRELLISLTHQTYKSFEILIIEDGSDILCEEIVNQFKDQLQLRYYFKQNSGQGFSRNFGFARAKGDYLVVFDSDCIVPPNYLETVNSVVQVNQIDCWGGPDKADSSFTAIQKAINFSMTSLLTTGGIRGSRKSVSNFHPRSFNMGISKEVFEKTGGYRITRMGEDIEFSIRINESGFNTVLIEEAYVYHKRRINITDFFKQLYFFGRARVNISRFYPKELKFVHLFPLFFLAGLITLPILYYFSVFWFQSLLAIYMLYFFLIFSSALMDERNVIIALLAVVASLTQLVAYALGFISEYKRKLLD
tara:strand:- start:200 stop:1159 length:960 start_codon:yes stop_codon:yes gene_type:complete